MFRHQKGHACEVPFHRELGASVAQQVAWSRPSTIAVFKGDFTVNHDPAIAFSVLHPTPFTSREVVHNLGFLEGGSSDFRGYTQLYQPVRLL